MSRQNVIVVKKIHHRNADRIGLFFDYNPAYISLIKQLKDRKFSKTLSCWYVPYHQDNLIEIKSLSIPLRIIGLKELLTTSAPSHNRALLIQHKEWCALKDQELMHVSPEQRIALGQMMDHMLISWYPIRTIKKYVNLLSTEHTESSPDILRALRVLSMSSRH